MKARSLYLTVRVDVKCPDGYDSSDLELATDFELLECHYQQTMNVK